MYYTISSFNSASSLSTPRVSDSVFMRLFFSCVLRWGGWKDRRVIIYGLKWVGQYLPHFSGTTDGPFSFSRPSLMFLERNNSMDGTIWPRPAQTTGLLLMMCGCPLVTLIVQGRQWECWVIKCAKSRLYNWCQSDIAIRWVLSSSEWTFPLTIIYKICCIWSHPQSCTRF